MSGITIGIPRALLFYNYYPMWKTFFEELGAQVVTSHTTTRRIVDTGVLSTVDEACLPVKIFHGHVADLVGRCDQVFVPRLVSVESRAYICPKFMGLPDMVQQAFKGSSRILTPCFDLSRSRRKFYASIWELGRRFTSSPLKIYDAYRKARRELDRYSAEMARGFTPLEILEGEDTKAQAACTIDAPTSEGEELRIAVLGHPYNIYDRFLSMNILDKVRALGARPVTPEMLGDEDIEAAAARLPKRLFWTLGRRILGAGIYLADSASVDGIIHVMSFGCGPESMVSDLLTREVRRRGLVPVMAISIDEHTGEAGLITRIEAFIDMINFRRPLPSREV